MKFLAAVFFLVALTSNALALSDSELAAKSRGITLYNQLKASTAHPLLKIAAEAGDHEAQFFLAEEIRQKKQYIDSEAYKWYEAAANQGDLYSMIRIGRSNNNLCAAMKNCPTGTKEPQQWLAEANKIAKQKSDRGDAEAQYLMYELTAERDWLKKSALAGHPTAQYRMAIGDRQGEGFILPWKRQEIVE